MQTIINFAKITSGSIFTISIFIGCSGVVVDKRESAAIASASSPKASANATCAKPTLALDVQTTHVGQIKPLIQSRCISCHNTGFINNYSNDKDVIRQGPQIVFSVKSGRMPKGSKLSDDEKALFAAWAAGGYLITETTTNNVTAPIAKLPLLPPLPPFPAITHPLGVAGAPAAAAPAAAAPAAGAPAAAAPAASVQPVPIQDSSAEPPAAPAAAAPQTCAAAAPVPATPADTTAVSAVAPEDSQNNAGTTANSTSVPGAVGDMTNVPSTTKIGTNTSNASAIAPPLGSAQASASAGASSASASSSAGNK